MKSKKGGGSGGAANCPPQILKQHIPGVTDTKTSPKVIQQVRQLDKNISLRN